MPNRLLFSNIPFNCSDELLKGWIEEHGFSVMRVRLIRDAVTGTSPNFAHVQLVDSARLDEAELALDRQTLGGRTLHVCRVVGIRTALHIKSS